MLSIFKEQHGASLCSEQEQSQGRGMLLGTEGVMLMEFKNGRTPNLLSSLKKATSFRLKRLEKNFSESAEDQN